MSRAIQASWLSRPENNARVKAAWEALLTGHLSRPLPVIRPAINESWRRCVAKHVSPFGDPRPPLERGELETLRRQNERLLAASAPFLVQARGFLAHTGTVMILTDAQGTILDVEGDAQLRDAIEMACLVPGYNWLEATMGTNAIGTALAAGQPVQVHASEHYREEVQKWTCSASVIHDPIDRSVLGVFDLSGLRRDYSPQSLALISAISDGVEAKLVQMETEQRLRLLDAAVTRLSSPEGVVVFDAHGRLVKANERASAAAAALGVTLTAGVRIPVGAARSGDDEHPLLPTWVVENRVEPVFQRGGLLGFVVSFGLPPQETGSRKTGTARRRNPAPYTALLATMIDQSVTLVALKDLDGRYEFVNRRFEEVFGLRSADVVGRTDADLFEPDAARQIRARDLEAMERTAPTASNVELDLGPRHVRLATSRFPVFDDQGQVVALCLQATELDRAADIAPAASPAEALRRADDGVMVTDAEGVILTVNDTFTRVTGHSRDEAVGKRPNLLKSGLHSKEFYDRMWRGLIEQGQWQGEIQNRRKSGEIFPEWLTIYSVKDAAGRTQNYVAIFGESAALATARERAEYATTHDSLTGLPNRELLTSRLSGCLAEARKTGERVAVLLIDLDDFKGVNDSLGHEIGDLLLRQAAERLRRSLCDAHTLARVGADQFAAILRGVDNDGLRRVAAEVLDYLSVSFCLRTHEVLGGACMGISVAPDDGSEAGELLRHAGTALNEAERRGRNGFQFFSSQMQVAVQERVTLATSLRAAIDNDRFEIVYQPQSELESGKLVGAEALLRWKDDVLGEVPAGRFIPAAVRAGLITPINEWVLNKVVGQVAVWREQGYEPPRISINIAAEQFHESRFVEHICELLELHGVPQKAICLELTEGTLMEDLDGGTELLSRLAERGIVASIDDFGTGYSSLAYLSRLPVHELKVDQSFVQGIESEPRKRSIVTAIIQMAHALGMTVLAEGIETEAQLSFLKERHCELGQGFLFHRPLDADSFEHLFATQAKRGQEPVALSAR
ncbi:MAG: EAL domain-containing protein [Aromatoleum sp.]|jgi:diguanylate cyclase (GGDEF)-like protein/PAS domain S-box-containing protein|uniref:EAL domain-containing protein n=1 Tax=Aromatoleum sp. TaxID=2307007 RepID=UPI002894A71C|nr:EAL domain-containing protein [Aromatoleum sp.]MDT3671265.1 EAL domain-containing protein [Aromatoleum sp.]